MQSPSQCLGSVRPDKLSRLKLRSEPKSLRLSVSDRLSHLGLFGSAVALTHSLRRVFPPPPRLALLDSPDRAGPYMECVRLQLFEYSNSWCECTWVLLPRLILGSYKFLIGNGGLVTADFYLKRWLFAPFPPLSPYATLSLTPLHPTFAPPPHFASLCVSLGGGILNFRGIRGGI